MYQSLIRKNPDAIRMIFGFLVLMISGIVDLIGSMGLISNLENYGILKYGFFVFEVGMVFILANRFLRVHKEAEELRNNFV